MIKKAMVVGLDNRADAMPVAMFVQVASQYESSIYVDDAEKRVNAKSIMGMTYLALTDDDIVQIMAEGSDEEAALNALTNLLEK